MQAVSHQKISWRLFLATESYHKIQGVFAYMSNTAEKTKRRKHTLLQLACKWQQLEWQVACRCSVCCNTSMHWHSRYHHLSATALKGTVLAVIAPFQLSVQLLFSLGLLASPCCPPLALTLYALRYGLLVEPSKCPLDPATSKVYVERQCGRSLSLRSNFRIN